jgi:hypothetical protein
MSIKIGPALAFAAILAAIASAYGNYRGPLPTSPEATISRTPGGPGQRFN